MNTRKERLHEVYEYLRNHNTGIHTKKDMAKAIDQTQPAMYSAFGGKEDYLTDKLFRRISYIFPFFNLEYLLNGTGELVKETSTPNSQSQDTIIDNMLATFAQMIGNIDNLRILLHDELQEIRDARMEMQKAREGYLDAIYRLNSAIDRMNNNQSYNIGMAAESNVSK